MGLTRLRRVRVMTARFIMSHNTFGHLFRVTTFGESHGRGIGCVVDGCPPRIPLEASDIQADSIGDDPEPRVSRPSAASRTRPASSPA